MFIGGLRFSMTIGWCSSALEKTSTSTMYVELWEGVDVT